MVTFDNRGHGMSEKPLDAGCYADERLWAEDLAAVIEQTSLDRPVLVPPPRQGQALQSRGIWPATVVPRPGMEVTAASPPSAPSRSVRFVKP